MLSIDPNRHQLPTISAVSRAYGQVAHRYDRSHRRWLRNAGQQAQDAFDGATAAIVQPGFRVLDAGCGTALVAKRLIRLCHGRLDVSLLDACPQMLAKAGSVNAEVRLGVLEEMPYPKGHFDLVTCAWALETTRRPIRALVELVRVTRPGGTVCFVSAAELGKPAMIERFFHRNMPGRKLGRLLTLEELSGIPMRFPKARVRLLQVGRSAALGIVTKGVEGSG